MFGILMMEHDRRYDMAEEWLNVIKLIWISEGEFDFEGKFYKVDKGFMEPKPIQRPFPPIMNAGGSDRGRHFTAKNCDVAFVLFNPEDPVQAKELISKYKKLAREEYGREIQVRGPRATWSRAKPRRKPATFTDTTFKTRATGRRRPIWWTQWG